MKKIINKKNTIIAVLVVAGLGVVFLLSATPKQEQASRADNTTEEVAPKQKANKVKVYYFHTSNRCASCRVLEKYTEETIKEFFQPELKDGKVEFKAINVELPENKDLARKYGATGSSLFVNRVLDGEDDIEQDTNVWRYLNNEKAFKIYLKDKIKTTLN